MVRVRSDSERKAMFSHLRDCFNFDEMKRASSNYFSFADESGDPRVLMALDDGSPFKPNNSQLAAYPGLGIGVNLDPYPNQMSKKKSKK